MAVKVLVVDDSSFFRRRVSEIINQDPLMTVIDTYGPERAGGGRQGAAVAARRHYHGH